jgi:hypothetical protein
MVLMLSEYLKPGLGVAELSLATAGSFKRAAPAVTPRAFNACRLLNERWLIKVECESQK